MNIALQPTSADIWATKYQLKDKNDTNIDLTPSDTFSRVAKAVADVELTDDLKAYWSEKFAWAMEHGALPAGRILANAGASKYKPATSTINCTVSGTIGDSMDDILQKVHEAGMTLKAGCGIGYEFSTLRPKNAYVSGAGAYTSGPLSFMDIFDKMCSTVSSAGGRRGAQMATFDINHPDVLDFITAKRENGRLRQFNCSLLVTDDFIQAVKSDGDWRLSFPITRKEAAEQNVCVDSIDDEKYLWRTFPGDHAEYLENDAGLVLCSIYETKKAADIWALMMTSTYDFAEPGLILVDEVNRLNNNWFVEEIRASNPCGEQMLNPYSSCLLGSINLTQFIVNPFMKTASFDWVTFKEVVSIFTRLLDNVVEINGLPLPQQREELYAKRRHGMGYLGLGTSMAMLGLSYGDEASLTLTEDITRELSVTGWKAGLALSLEKGPAPLLAKTFVVTSKMLAQRPEMLDDGYSVGSEIKGSVLHAKYSKYMQRIAEVEPELIEELAKHGSRFTHHTSIAPTGTTSLSLGNNVSNGIEPSFAHHYARNVIVAGRKTKQKVDVFSYELLAYRALVNPNAMPNVEGFNALPDNFVVCDTISPESHILVQAAAQKWIDSSISKTANVPTDYPFEDFKNIYMLAYESGLKGCTTFRFNPEAFQGVLVKEEDLANTLYEFTTDDGSKVEFRGNEEIEYEGEIHTAANLFDAFKENTYSTY